MLSTLVALHTYNIVFKTISYVEDSWKTTYFQKEEMKTHLRQQP